MEHGNGCQHFLMRNQIFFTEESVVTSLSDDNKLTDMSLYQGLIMEVIGIVVILILTILLNGVIAEVEDNSPRGMNNPDGKWIDTIKSPTKVQLAVWLSGTLTLIWLICISIAV